VIYDHDRTPARRPHVQGGRAPAPLEPTGLLGIQRTAGNAAAGLVVQRAWLDEQVDLVRPGLEVGREEESVRILNGYSFDDIRRIVGKLPKAARARLKAVLGDFVGRFDVERIRTGIALAEGGGSTALVKAVEEVHHLIRAGVTPEVFEHLTKLGPDLRGKVLQRLSTGHIKALVDNMGGLQEWRQELVTEANRRPGLKVSEGREFDASKTNADGENEAVEVRSFPAGPDGAIVSMLMEGPEDAAYELTLNTHHDNRADFVGHAWIGVTELAWPRRRFTFGFWPAGSVGKAILTAAASGTGVVASPDPYHGETVKVSRTQVGKREAIKALQSIVRGYNGERYWLLGLNCATFAARAWSSMTGDHADRELHELVLSPQDIASETDRREHPSSEDPAVPDLDSYPAGP